MAITFFRGTFLSGHRWVVCINYGLQGGVFARAPQVFPTFSNQLNEITRRALCSIADRARTLAVSRFTMVAGGALIAVRRLSESDTRLSPLFGYFPPYVAVMIDSILP